mgnify:CR=1 FL=1
MPAKLHWHEKWLKTSHVSIQSSTNKASLSTKKTAFYRFKKRSIGILLMSFFVWMHMHAQEKPLAWYEANFPKEHAIRLLDETNIVIQVDAEKGVQVSTTYVDEKMLVSGQAAAFSERQIVFSSFFNVRDVEASSYDLKNSGKYSKNKIEEFRTEKIMNDRVFHDDLQAVKFKYPDLKKGSKNLEAQVKF